MRLSLPLTRSLSKLLVALLAFTAVPAKALAEPNPVPNAALIGSLSATGSVELRGVAISRDGTLFSGDTIRTHSDGYASVALSGGQQIELGGDTDVRVEAGGEEVEIAMSFGRLAFASPSSGVPVRINMSPYDIVAAGGSAGDIALLSEGELGVRALSGTMTVRSSSGGESVIVREGETQVIDFGDPARPRSLPPTAQQLTSGEWTAVAIGVGLGAGSWIAYFIVRDTSPSNP